MVTYSTGKKILYARPAPIKKPIIYKPVPKPAPAPIIKREPIRTMPIVFKPITKPRMKIMPMPFIKR
jgi:hypothetical protein